MLVLVSTIAGIANWKMQYVGNCILRSLGPANRRISNVLKRLPNMRSLSISNQSLQSEESDFDASAYRNELHVVGTAATNPRPRYKLSSSPDEDKGDPIGYSFSMDIPSFGKDSSVRCSVVAYTFPNAHIAEYIASEVRQGMLLEIDGFLRKTVSRSWYDDSKKVAVYSIGPTAIRSVEIDDDMEASIE